MEIHLVDGTYELFRQHFGRAARGAGRPETGGVRGVLASTLALLEGGATHVGVATDHVIESFRNGMWPGYKTGEGVPSELMAQFEPLEVALGALGVTVWPMVELEADDALASAAAVAAADHRVERALLCTPDKDLAQCVRGGRVVQLDRRSGQVTDEAGVQEKFGVLPESIPDWLGLVGDAADGFPGIPGWGKRSASVVLTRYRHVSDIPRSVSEWEPGVRAGARGAERLSAALEAGRSLADLFVDLATLRVEPSLLGSIDELAWPGPTEDLGAVCEWLGDGTLSDRANRLAEMRHGGGSTQAASAG
jgi:5'-3' exonuclease